MKMDKKILIIIGLIALVSVILFFGYGGQEVSFELDDRCGPIMNLLSHTIKDEPACKNQCRSQCKVKDLEFKEAKFEAYINKCNNCTCVCK